MTDPTPAMSGDITSAAERIADAMADLRWLLSNLYEPGHPGEPAHRSGWIADKTIEETWAREAKATAALASRPRAAASVVGTIVEREWVALTPSAEEPDGTRLVIDTDEAINLPAVGARVRIEVRDE